MVVKLDERNVSDDEITGRQRELSLEVDGWIERGSRLPLMIGRMFEMVMTRAYGIWKERMRERLSDV